MNVLPGAALAATMAWAGTANASIVLDGNGNVAFGIEKKLALDDFGNPTDLLFVTNIYVRFTEATDSLVSIGFSQMFTKNGSDFYSAALGGELAPSEDLILNGSPPFVPPLPGLVTDTFVTIGIKTNNDLGQQTALFPAIGGIDSTFLDFDYVNAGNKISGGWGHNPDNNQGRASTYGLSPDNTYWILVAQLTVDFKPGNGVAGDMIVFWTDAAGVILNNFGSFNNQVPSPGALALLGLAGLVGVRRRRRR
ncbi:MAG: hypothetical protein IH983_12655 [Planctomycetes bacterium]|nr:hypothetical protein [Planctomycetota bacterium]